MKRSLITLLEKSGCSAEEIRAYIGLLQKSPLTLCELQHRTKSSHTTTYRVIQKLIEKGLVASKPINNKQSVYSPLSLSSLITSLQKQQRSLKKLELSLSKIDHLIPYLDLSQDADLLDTSDECIEVITTVDKFCEEYLKLPERGSQEFLALGSSDNFWKASRASIDSPLERSFVSRRLKNNVYSRSMMVDTNDARKIAMSDSKEKRTTKLKPTLPVISDMMMICGNQVSYFVCDAENPHVIHMRHPSLVTMHKQQFESLWTS